MSKRKKIAVIGIGDFGKVLVKCLHKEGHEVLAIDEEAERIEEIKDFCSDVAIMNSTDEVAMSNMGFNDFDRVIALDWIGMGMSNVDNYNQVKEDISNGWIDVNIICIPIEVGYILDKEIQVFHI
jgi:D-arabinose 1-dehydrogenase-like Zn-dependent alcohol dehydrogenase